MSHHIESDEVKLINVENSSFISIQIQKYTQSLHM